MAYEVDIGGDGELFVGEDKLLRLEIIDSAGLPVNIAGWNILWDVRVTEIATTPALLTKTGSVSGTFNASRASNTQRALFQLTNTELDLLSARIYRHSFKRLGSGVNTIVVWGKITPQKATAD